jgi:hypothetical protein
MPKSMVQVYCRAGLANVKHANELSSEKVDEKTPILPPDWEVLIEQIANEIIEERTPARILQVRAKLYDLLTHCIPASTVLKVCVKYV